ncbi:MAG TPA: IPT/TIG domain-containing protein [Gemmatimonadales bacterium]
MNEIRSGAGRVGLTAGIVLLAACKGGDPLPDATRLEAVASSVGQTAPAGSPLPGPLAVLASDASGAAVTGARIRWSIVDGPGAALSDSITESDGTGRAEANLTLGPTPGEYRVRAELVALPDERVVLTANASQPMTLTAVAPAAFTGGDTVVVSGTGLSPDTRVTVGGGQARVLSGSTLQLSIVVPICLVPGPVQLRARRGNAVSNAISATFQAATNPVTLAVGEYASIEPAQLAGCATFGPVSDTAEFLVVPQSVTGTPGQSASYSVVGDSVVFAPAARAARPDRRTPAERFHDALRAEERAMAARSRGRARPMALAAATERITVGQKRSFLVCSDLPCASVDDMVEVSGTARYVGEHAALFVDANAPVNFAPVDLDSLGLLFDDELYGVGTRYFGAESDIDRNGVVIVLFTPVINGLTPKSQCPTSIITGYFFGGDIDPVAVEIDDRSNRGEIFYTLAADPDGAVTCTITLNSLRNLVPVTFSHEFQHMINFNQHVLVRGGDSEVLWLNEGMSHLAEELTGFHFEAQGLDARFARFVIGDLFNSYTFLQDPGAFFALPGEGTGSLEERGAAWMFLRWLVDQYGDGIVRRLSETGRSGSDNIEAVVGEPISRLLAQWFLAAYASDLPDFDAPPELRFTTWRFRTTYGGLHADLPTRFPDPYPIIPAEFNVASLQGAGTLRSGSGAFYLIRQRPDGRGFTLRMTNPSGGAIDPAVMARLNVLRLR